MKKTIKVIKEIWKEYENQLSWLLLVIFALIVALVILNPFAGDDKSDLSKKSTVTDTVSAEELVDTFPLLKGSYWIYQASVKWTVTGGNEVIEDNFTWKMEVIDTATHNNIIAVYLRGFPWELDWHHEDLEPDDYTMIIVDAKKFYLLQNTRAFEKIKNKEDLADDFSDDDLWFDFPLTLGKTYAYMNELAKQREDHYYQWYVKNESPADLSSVKGALPAAAAETEYEIEFYTLPGHRTINFVPGIGITGYTYVHHGTISEAYLKLIEYHLPK